MSGSLDFRGDINAVSNNKGRKNFICLVTAFLDAQDRLPRESTDARKSNSSFTWVLLFNGNYIKNRPCLPPEIGTNQCKIEYIGEEMVKKAKPVITQFLLLKVIVLRFSTKYLAAF